MEFCFTCWGSPFPEKPGRSRPGPAAARMASGLIAGPLEAARAESHGRSSNAQIEGRWDVLPLSVGGVLLIMCVVELVTAR